MPQPLPMLQPEQKRYRPSDPVDACIVGGGIGAVMARVLAEGGLSVVLLEAGPHWNPAKDWINDPHVMDQKFFWPDPPISGTTSGIQTGWGVGGNMSHWGACTVRFLPSVFLSRSMKGYGDDWPITYEELVPYYQQAERDFGVAGDHTTYPVPRDPFPLPPHPIRYADKVLRKGFDALGYARTTVPQPRAILSRPYQGRPACNYCGYCHEGCTISALASPVRTHIPHAIAAGAEVRAHSYAIRITEDPSGQASGVVYVDSDGNEQEQKARLVVVACNSPLSARLLLLSKSTKFPNGLANNSGQVGSHVLSRGGGAGMTVIFEERLEAYRGFGTLQGQEFFESDEKRGFVGGIQYNFHPPDAPLENMVRQGTGAWGSDLKAFMTDFYPYAMRLSGGISTGVVNEKNRVDLDPVEKDRHGLPLVRVMVYPTDNDEAIRKFNRKILQDIGEAAGAAKVMVDGVPRATFGGGECRMGNDPNTSVVNSFCQTHEVKNLFLLGSSICVTGAHTEPTLTLIALAYRSGEYILRNRTDIPRA